MEDNHEDNLEFVDQYPPGVGDEDEFQVDAVEQLLGLFERRVDQVYFSRQLEVRFERKFYHWVTNRALGELVAKGVVLTEPRQLKSGGRIHLVWHRKNRYYKRAAKSLVDLVSEYAAPNIGASLGLHGEMMVLEAFARNQFVLHGRATRRFRDREWTQSDHTLDFIFERDGLAYGVEVKNKLGYSDLHPGIQTKVMLCEELGIRPAFVCRMLPKNWIWEIAQAGGFALILEWQLYPWTHRDLAKRVHSELELRVDSPRAIYEATMERFLKWHRSLLGT